MRCDVRKLLQFLHCLDFDRPPGEKNSRRSSDHGFLMQISRMVLNDEFSVPVPAGRSSGWFAETISRDIFRLSDACDWFSQSIVFV